MKIERIDGRIHWKYYRSSIPRAIRMFPREIKWFFQRGRRGWADIDIVYLDTYLAKILSEALPELARTSFGHPCLGLSNPKCYDNMPSGHCVGNECYNAYIAALREGAYLFRGIAEDRFTLDDTLSQDRDDTNYWLTVEEENDNKAYDWLKEWHGTLWD